jgi:thiosulfate dehydrogenase
MTSQRLLRFALRSCIGGSIWACAACSDAPATPAERGRELFESKALSPSALNHYRCSDCHVEAPPPSSSLHVLKTGAALAGVTQRPRFWGGQVSSLLEAVNACRAVFMGAPDPLAASDAPARDLYAYLESLAPGNPSLVPFTVVREIELLPRGDAGKGEVTYARACATCHGAMHDGSGRLSERVPILPEDTIAEHSDYSPRSLRLVFTEKIRHGGFWGYGGDMPPFSREVMTDAEIADVLETMGVFGE